VIPSGLFLVDTSAAARAGNTSVRFELDRLGRLGLLARCVTVDLEVLYSARSPEEYSKIAALREASLPELPLTKEIGRRALMIQRELAKTSQHRSASVIDLLTAAVAEHYGATVLHYDSDFDNIALVTRQPTEWIVPRGSVS
jgi:predicted nucleic acid-binding protein